MTFKLKNGGESIMTKHTKKAEAIINKTPKTARRIKQAEALTGRTDTTRKKPPDLDQAAFYEAGKEWDSDAGLCFVFPKTSASQIQTRITVIK